MQDDYLIFEQLSRTSPLPGFVTDVSEAERAVGNRVVVPLADADVSVSYYLTAVDGPNFRWRPLIDWIQKRLA